MPNLKKAQISDTLSWIVATIIIVLLLSIPIFLAQIGKIGKNGFIYFERIQDPIATKSISGYLLMSYKEKIEKGVQEEDSNALEELISPLLISLSRGDFEQWNVKIYLDESLIYKDINYHLANGENSKFINRFYFSMGNGELVVFEYWMEGQMYD